MSEATIGIVVFALTAVASAAIWHWLLRHYFLASFGAAICAALMFQVFAYLHAGYLDPFYPIAVVVSLAIAFVVALIVGPLIEFFRLRYEDSRSQ